MRILMQKHRLSFIAVCLLVAFVSTLFEASYEHFFHDILPEHANGYFSRQNSRPTTPGLQRAVFASNPEACSFNNFLSSLEKFSHITPFAIQADWLFNEAFSLPESSSLTSGQCYSQRARAPPTV
ncbi:MAG TPA: hypothetical protein DCG57_10715 [Candidatus Riflebacteria bacterium]|nr:hypothetical protein [Candidatus Riflebacteria bacterium]